MSGRLQLILVLAATIVVGTAPAALQTKPDTGDQWLSRPVDDRTFRTYLDFFAYDRQIPLDVRTQNTVERDGVRIERLSYQSTRGIRVAAALYQPQASAGGGAVILLPGGVALGKDAPGPVAVASLLARAGWTVLTMDFLHFGERATDLFVSFSEQEKHERLYNQPPAYLAWITQTVKDASRGYDLLVERKINPRRIALAGVSRGAIVASIITGLERRFAGAALLFGAHFDALENNHLPAACPANYIGRISPRPLLMINGLHDTDMIKDRAVEPLFRLARQPKQIIWTEGGHGFWTDDHRAAMIQWLREKIK